MAFKVFRRTSRASTKEPVASIGKRGIISLNGAAFALLTGGLDDTEAFVELLYDPDAKIVGLRTSDEGGANSYKMRKAKKSSTYMVSGSAFTNYHGIPIGGASTRYHARAYDNGIVGFSLADDEVT